jgi:hypothetical protein
MQNMFVRNVNFYFLPVVPDLFAILDQEGKNLMLRHFERKRLKPPNHLTLFPSSPSIWDLPPYEIARFGGELSKVILHSVEQFIFEKSYARQKMIFQSHLSTKKDPS